MTGVILIIGVICAFNVVQAFDAQGHRGARGLMPENSLPGFALALEIGVNTLELDVVVTRDFEVVVMHDLQLQPKIARRPDGLWLTSNTPGINTLSLDEVQSYDVGRLNPAHRYASSFPTQTAIDGTKVPTLGQVFELVKHSDNRSVKFNIETKINPLKPELSHSPEDFVGAIMAVVEKYQMQQRVTIQSFDWRTLDLVQKSDPNIATAYLSVEQEWFNQLETGLADASPWLNGIDVDDFDGVAAKAIHSAGGSIWSPYHKDVDVASIELAHKLGLKVIVWTVNKAQRMHELIDMGVDGIITDYPDRLRQVMKKRNMPLPPTTTETGAD
ncbi:MAG: glycerophosphodiester phosphodiesterase [Pseudomonadota bacterium]